MYYTIYRTRNLINNKEYTGQHITEDLNDLYLGSGTVLKQAIEKYGKENFTKTILFVCDTFEEMNALEKLIVNEDYIGRSDTYNMALGGKGGACHTTPHTEESKKKISINNKGKTHTRKTIKHLSDTKKGSRNPMYGKKGQENPNFGKVMMTTPEGKYKRIQPEKVETYLSENWTLGWVGWYKK